MDRSKRDRTEGVKHTSVEREAVVQDAVVLPVIEEQLELRKRTVETGGLRVHKTVHEREELIDEPLLREELQIERVPINRPVSAPLEVRYEGDVMIIPVLEEVLVVEKRLVLKEELRVTRSRRLESSPQRVTLRTEEATIERIEPRPGETARGGNGMEPERT